MAVALVGTIGAASQGTAGNAVTPAWGASENRTAGNLLICFVSVTQTATLPTTPAGWSIAVQKAGTLSSVTIYHKVAMGADAAPTIGAITSGVIAAQLAEFSGAVASVIDQSANGTASSTPVTITNGAVDAFSGSLLLTGVADRRSIARSTNDTFTSNNATFTQAGNNNGTSSTNHYSWAYGATTSKVAADTSVAAFSVTTNLSGAALGAVSFKPGLTKVTTFTAAAVIFWTQLPTFTANAVLRVARAGSFTADAAIKKIQTGSFTANAFILGYFRANAAIEGFGDYSPTWSNLWGTPAVTGNFAANAVLKKTLTPTFAANAVLFTNSGTKTFTADAALKKTMPVAGATFTAAAAIKKTITPTFLADAVLFKNAGTKTLLADAIVKKTMPVAGASFTAAATILKPTSFTDKKADAVLKRTMPVAGASFPANAVIKKNSGTLTATANAIVKKTMPVATFTAAAAILKTQASSLTANAVIFRTQTPTFAANSVLLKTQASTFSANAVVKKTITPTFAADAIIAKTLTPTFAANAVLAKSASGTFAADAVFAKSASGTFTAAAIIGKTQLGSLTFNAVIKASVTGTKTADAIRLRTFWFGRVEDGF